MIGRISAHNQGVARENSGRVEVSSGKRVVTVDVKGSTVDVKGSTVDVKGSAVDVKGLMCGHHLRRFLLGVREKLGGGVKGCFRGLYTWKALAVGWVSR